MGNQSPQVNLRGRGGPHAHVHEFVWVGLGWPEHTPGCGLNQARRAHGHAFLAIAQHHFYIFLDLGAMYVTKPYKFTGFGAMDVTKPYKFIRFGAMDVTKAYKFIKFWGHGCHQTL